MMDELLIDIFPYSLETIIAWMITIVFCFVIGTKYRWNIANETGNKSEYTTWGMLGTFLGICVGLIKFDPEKISETLPILLGGLQFAFITSIVGLFCSIWHEEKSKNWELNTEDDPTNNLLKKISENVKALGKDGDDTLLGQFKMLRVDFNDFAKNVAKTSSQSATKAIVEALTEVIKDFNIKITEQFGDNFKHLNESVGKLLEWQREYKDYMDGFKENLALVSNAIETNSQAVSTLPEHIEKISVIVQKTDDELKKLMTTTNSLQGFSEKLEDAVPQFISAVENLTEEAREQTIQLSQETAESIKKLSKEVVDANTELSHKTITQMEDISKSTSNSLKELNIQTQQTVPAMKKTLEDVIGNTDEQLEVLGRHIVSIVQKLVEDFDNLSNTLKRFQPIDDERNI